MYKALILSKAQIDYFPQGRSQYSNAVIYNNFENIEVADQDKSISEVFILADEYEQLIQIVALLNDLNFKRAYLVTDHTNWVEKQKLASAKIYVILKNNRADIICGTLIAEANE